MKKIIFLILTFLFLAVTGFAQSKAGKEDTSAHKNYYTCSMHPEVMLDKPGNCPKCGMALILSTKEQMKVKETKTYNCPTHLDVTSHNPGKCPKCGKKMALSMKEEMKAEAAKLYTCPMHPEVALDKEGKCPKCGKDLVEKTHDHN